MTMKALFVLISTAAASALLWLLYLLLFSRVNRFQFNRFFLLSSLLFSILLPLTAPLITISSPSISYIKHDIVDFLTINPIIIYSNDVTDILTDRSVISTGNNLDIVKKILTVYGIGVIITSIIFIIKLRKIITQIIRGKKVKKDSYTIIYTNNNFGFYSFFNYMFLPDENTEEVIKIHELSHIRHKHSYDIIFIEIMKIIQWFNPFMYMYNKELQSLHEYIADSDVLTENVNKKDYMMLIMQQCTAVEYSVLSNNFSLVLIKKRIKMMTKNKKKPIVWRVIASMPIIALLFIFSTRTMAQDNAEKQNDDSLYKTSYHDAYSFADAVNNSTDRVRLEATNDESLRVTLQNGVEFDLTVNGGFYINNDSIYPVADELPQFPGGMEEMVKFIADNIKYPEAALENNIEARVYIQFVIEKDGSISNAKSLKEQGYGLDKEAIRVVSSMPKWTPGKSKGEIVRSQFTIPVVYKLNNKVEE